MFTCERCKKKVTTVGSKNHYCTDCNKEVRAEKKEEPSPTEPKVESVPEEEPKLEEKTKTPW